MKIVFCGGGLTNPPWDTTERSKVTSQACGEWLEMDNQGLTLRFQARGRKRNFDKNQWSKIRFLVIKHTILGP